MSYSKEVNILYGTYQSGYGERSCVESSWLLYNKINNSEILHKIINHRHKEDDGG